MRCRRKEATVEQRNFLPAVSTLFQESLYRFNSFRKAKHIYTDLFSLAFIALSIALSVPAQATSNGISGFSGMNGSTCTGCHSSGSAPTVTLTGPTSVASGSTNSYTLSVSTVTAGNGGMDLAASGGTFAAGTGTKVLNGEVVHSAPSSSHTWTFSWTAPTVTATTTVTFYAAAIDSFGGGTGTLKQAITVTAPVANPTLSTTPASLSFSYQTGGTVPGAQSVSVASSGSAISYNVATSATWLSATPASGSTPGSVSVSVKPASLAAGTYTGSVTLTSSGASNSPKTIPVTLTVTSATLPTLNATPSNLSFTYQTGAAVPAAQSVSVASSGSAISYNVSTSATWLSATPASGTTAGSVSVSVNPQSLAAGTYTGSVSLTSSGASNSPKTIPITLTVTSASLPTITATPSNLSFTYQTGGATPAAQTVKLTSSSSSALSYSVASSAAWLVATPASGSTPGSLSLSVNPSGLSTGTYSGTVTVTAAGASNSPLKIGATLTVTSASTGASLTLTPGSLSFNYQSGSAATGSQTLSVASTGAALSFTAAASGGSWLSVGSTTGSTPTSLKVAVNASGLAAGTYNGSITITSSTAANSPQTVPVRLVVGSGGGTGHLRIWPPRAVTFEYQSGQADPAPRSIKVLSTGTPLSYTASALGGSWLSVTPSGGTTPGTLSISANPTGLASGTYTATVKISAQGTNGLSFPVVLRVVSSDDGGGDDDGGSGGTGGSGGGGGDDASTSLHAWPYAYDPAGSNSVAATWVDGTGAATKTPTDTRQQGLLLSKTSAASTQAQAGVVIRDVEGMTLIQLGYDIRTGSQCTATSPRFVVVTTDDVVHKIGCSTGTAQPAPAAGWTRLRFDPANPAQTSPAIATGSKVKSIYLVLDDGPETGASMVVIDNININGTFIGKQ
jgi:Viral BACON domain